MAVAKRARGEELRQKILAGAHLLSKARFAVSNSAVIVHTFAAMED
jgi:hypothetical protein